MNSRFSLFFLILVISFVQGCQFITNKNIHDNHSTNNQTNVELAAVSSQNTLIEFNSSFNEAQMKAITSAYTNAKKRLMVIFGSANISQLKANICHIDECDSSFLNLNKRQNFAYSSNLSNELLSAWIVSEINQRQGRSRKTNIPTWFKYGFAAAASDDQRYLEKNYLTNIFLPPAVNIFDLDTEEKWRWAQKKYASYPFDIVPLIAAQEVRSWYQYSDGFPITRLIKEVNFGADFDLVYQHLSDIYSAIDIK